MPTIELHIRDVGEYLRGLLTLHHDEIQQHVKAGVERVLATLGDQIIDEAARLTAEKVQDDVKRNLLYGAGGQAIRAAVAHALAPLTAMLRAAAREERPNADDMAESLDASSGVVGPGRDDRRLHHPLRALWVQWPHPSRLWGLPTLRADEP